MQKNPLPVFCFKAKAKTLLLAEDEIEGLVVVTKIERRKLLFATPGQITWST